MHPHPHGIPLPRSFYEHDAATVARELLGHWLIRNTPKGPCGGIIVETEAYLADDPACHAFGGETARNRSMFGPPGHAYVYLIYGMHHCVNAVCRPQGVGEAVLIRAIEPTFDQAMMRDHRPKPRLRDLTSGPAKLCEALRIGRGLDGVDLCLASSPLFIAGNPDLVGTRRRLGPVVASTRIGITKAADLPLRFLLGGSEWVSRRAAGRGRRGAAQGVPGDGG